AGAAGLPGQFVAVHPERAGGGAHPPAQGEQQRGAPAAGVRFEHGERPGLGGEADPGEDRPLTGPQFQPVGVHERPRGTAHRLVPLAPSGREGRGAPLFRTRGWNTGGLRAIRRAATWRPFCRHVPSRGPVAAPVLICGTEGPRRAARTCAAGRTGRPPAAASTATTRPASGTDRPHTGGGRDRNRARRRGRPSRRGPAARSAARCASVPLTPLGTGSGTPFRMPAGDGPAGRSHSIRTVLTRAQPGVPVGPGAPARGGPAKAGNRSRTPCSRGTPGSGRPGRGPSEPIAAAAGPGGTASATARSEPGGGGVPPAPLPRRPLG